MMKCLLIQNPIGLWRFSFLVGSLVTDSRRVLHLVVPVPRLHALVQERRWVSQGLLLLWQQCSMPSARKYSRWHSMHGEFVSCFFLFIYPTRLVATRRCLFYTKKQAAIGLDYTFLLLSFRWRRSESHTNLQVGWMSRLGVWAHSRLAGVLPVAWGGYHTRDDVLRRLS